jgi:hypothetical protein
MSFHESARQVVRLSLASLCVAVACGKGGAPKVSLSDATTADSVHRMESAHALLGPAAKAQLDTGNTLYRARDYAGALTRYRTAADLAPQHAAPLFGIYMVAHATGNTSLADSALAEIRKRNGPMTDAPHTFSDSALREMHKRLGAQMPSPKS